MLLKTKKDMLIMNATIMLIINAIYMIVVAINGMSFVTFSGFEVPINANLMVLLYILSLLLNMYIYALSKKELNKKIKSIVTVLLITNAIIGMAGAISVLSIMSVALLYSSIDSQKEIETKVLRKYIILGCLIGMVLSFLIGCMSSNWFIAICEGMLIGISIFANIAFIKVK